MRTGLLYELSVIGYEIFLQGENIRLRYQKPGNPPDTVKPLIDELKKHKAEAVSILKASNTITTTEVTQLEADMKASWPAPVQSLVDWFTTLEHPTAPFYLEDHRRIVDPAKFFSSLQADIKAGPDGPRGRHGALIHDLSILKKVMH